MWYRVFKRFLKEECWANSTESNIKSHGKWRKEQPRVLLDLGATLPKIGKNLWHFQTEKALA